jgi:hypothetical protein
MQHRGRWAQSEAARRVGETDEPREGHRGNVRPLQGRQQCAAKVNQRVTPSCSRRGHGDGHLTVGPRTQTMHGNRIPVHRVAEREFAGEDTEERDHHSSARVQERQRWGAQVKGAPQRVDVRWQARSTPTPPGRDVVRSRVRGQGSLPGKRCLRAQMIAKAAIREGGGWKRSRQLLRGAQHTLQPGMVRRHSGTGGSTDVKESLAVRRPRRGAKACRVAEMSEVTRTFTGQDLTHRQKHFRRDTRPASPARFAWEGADAGSQATCREKKLIKVHQRGRVPRAAPLPCPGGQVRNWAPDLHAILQNWRDDRMDDAQLGGHTDAR